ncbi:hypothetical protein A3F66_02125 [candidate division TM6 bacterium RIFCSPHIGHO2_12_FULL_32_22]|nr:MAG: hypothetical protein A3F66_02125 [candidate division TM6 bacterium RIFCSPHIGHO2_12_FULL_32_22]
MAQLIQLKQRITAIQTIKKITNAMRIISMSLHSRLGHKLVLLKNYQKGLNDLLYVTKQFKKNSNHEENNINKINNKKALIIIGSDKGLCGTFNSNILKLLKNENLSEYELITVGKKISDNIKNIAEIKNAFHNFNYRNLNRIAAEIYDLVEQGNYSEIICINTLPKSFFIQLSQKKRLFPIKYTEESTSLNVDEYVWEETPETVYQSLEKEYLRFSISYALFESLFAEQAARFQSMDSATRNAENILEEMQIQYSKLRQAKITQEISELTSHF